MNGKNTTFGGGGFHHRATRVSDFDASVQFYTRVLGFAEKVRWGEGGKWQSCWTRAITASSTCYHPR